MAHHLIIRHGTVVDGTGSMVLEQFDDLGVQLTAASRAVLSALPADGRADESSFAEEPLPEKATLSDLLDYVQKHNPALKAARARWNAARAAIGEVGAWPDPKVSYGYFLEEVETRVGPQEQRVDAPYEERGGISHVSREKGQDPCAEDPGPLPGDQEHIPPPAEHEGDEHRLAVAGVESPRAEGEP